MLQVLLVVSTVLGVAMGIGMLARGDEAEELRQALLLPDMYLKEHQIREIYGDDAADYWKIVVQGGDQAHWKRRMEIVRSFGRQDEVEKRVSAAIAARFAIVPELKRDIRIERQHQDLRARLPELSRRSAFSQRLKDCMAWIGGAAVCGLSAWGLALFERSKSSRHPQVA